MKLIDAKKGKVLGVNFVDLVAIALVLFLALSFARTVLGDPLSFTGEEVYRAVKAYDKLMSKGFLVEAEVVGRAIGDPTGEKRVYKGMVVSGKGGTLVLKNTYGDRVSIGGSMSYLEDVAADRIRLRPLYRASISFYSNKTHFSSFDSFVSLLDRLRRESGASRVVVSGEVDVTQPSKRYLDVKRSLEGCYLCLDARVYKLGEDLYMLQLTSTDVEVLRSLSMRSGEVVVKNLKIYLGYASDLDSEEIAAAKRSATELGLLRDVGEATYVSVDELL